MCSTILNTGYRGKDKIMSLSSWSLYSCGEKQLINKIIKKILVRNINEEWIRYLSCKCQNPLLLVWAEKLFLKVVGGSQNLWGKPEILSWHLLSQEQCPNCATNLHHWTLLLLPLPVLRMRCNCQDLCPFSFWKKAGICLKCSSEWIPYGASIISLVS